jgi:hypothetical protein
MMKNAQLTVRLLVAATFANGILASGNINRGLVDMPAWRHVGPEAWAAFSRFADLGRVAMVLYPLEAFAGMILSVIVAVQCYRSGPRLRSARVPIYAAALLTVGGLVMTVRAAPIMLSVRHMGDDRVALQRAFEGFELWGGIRGIFQVLAYAANLWALVVVLSHVPKSQPN